MRLSTRNQLPGTVESVTSGQAMSVVRVRLDGGEVITASITQGATEDLGLAPGAKVVVLVKSTDVMLAID